MRPQNRLRALHEPIAIGIVGIGSIGKGLVGVENLASISARGMPMGPRMETLERVLESISSVVWGPPMLVLLFGTHSFSPCGCASSSGTWARRSACRSRATRGRRRQPFGALTTALAATIGTGNIVGVATAVAAGGPGAVLWMWLTGVFGIATKYAEALLSVKYRIRTPDGD